MFSLDNRRRLTAAVWFAALASTAANVALGEGLQRKLTRPASAAWRDGALGAAIEKIADAHQTPVWLDRRVDPGSPITLNVPATTLAGLFNRVGDESALGVCVVGQAVYLGPHDSAAALASRPPATGKLAERARAQWPRLTTPREAATLLAEQAGVRLANADLLPHDLLNEWDGPPAPVADHLGLLLSGFGLAWRLEGDVVTLVEAPAAASTQPVRLPESPRRPERRGREMRYTLRIENQPLGPVVKQLASQMGLELVRHPGVNEAVLARTVSVAVEQASRDELLRAIGKAGGVELRANGQELSMTAAP